MSETEVEEPIEVVAARVEHYFSDCQRANMDDIVRLEDAGLLRGRKATKQDAEESDGEFERGEIIYDWTEGGRALLQNARWRPIESAPRDGTHILAFPILFEVACVVSWERPAKTPPMMRALGEEVGHDGFWRLPMTGKKAPYDPTCWMPIPKPNT